MAGYKRYRKDSPISYSLGITVTFELLQHRREYVDKIYVHPSLREGETGDRLCQLCLEADIPLQRTDRIFHVLSQKENCYVIGEFRKFPTAIQREVPHIVLVSPSNAGNLGTIMRSGLGFGMDQIAIVRPAVDAFDPKVIRASMGAVFSTQFQYFDSFAKYQEQFGDRELYPFMLQAERELRDIRPSGAFSLIFGNEASGLPQKFLDIGTAVRIPHSGRIDSLNLPVAVGIAMYDHSVKNHLSR